MDLSQNEDEVPTKAVLFCHLRITSTHLLVPVGIVPAVPDNTFRECKTSLVTSQVGDDAEDKTAAILSASLIISCVESVT